MVLEQLNSTSPYKEKLNLDISIVLFTKINSKRIRDAMWNSLKTKIRENQDDFLDYGNDLLDKTVRSRTLQVNDGLWVIMMCQYRLISYNKCTTLVGDLIVGENMHMWGQGYMGNLILQFFYEHKTSQKY